MNKRHMIICAILALVTSCNNTDKNKSLLDAQSKALSDFESKRDSIHSAYKRDYATLNDAFWHKYDSIQASKTTTEKKMSAFNELSENYKKSELKLNENRSDALAKEWAKCDSLCKAYEAQKTR